VKRPRLGKARVVTLGAEPNRCAVAVPCTGHRVRELARTDPRERERETERERQREREMSGRESGIHQREKQRTRERESVCVREREREMSEREREK